MKRPTVASLKKVTVENLAGLGAERLAALLVAFSANRPDLRRRLRMELAAEQGSEHLATEVDKRLASLETSRSRVSWRLRARFVADLDVLRVLIAERLAGLDRARALDRMWLFMVLARRLDRRVRDRDGAMQAVFARAAEDLGQLLAEGPGADAAGRLADAIAGDLVGWRDWLSAVLAQVPPSLSKAVLELTRPQADGGGAWSAIVRQLADAAGDVEAFRSSFSPQALRTPAIAAEVAGRLLAAGQVEEAGRLLEAAAENARPATAAADSSAEPDFAWETAWITFLEQSGQGEAAQALRWSSFERTLSAERARAFAHRLTDFEDVVAEERAIAYATAHQDVRRGLQFLVEWPALPAAARMIEQRADDLRTSDQEAELWAARLRTRYPAAAHILLRKAAAAAFRRRDFATCDRLTREADALAAP